MLKKRPQDFFYYIPKICWVRTPARFSLYIFSVLYNFQSQSSFDSDARFLEQQFQPNAFSLKNVADWIHLLPKYSICFLGWRSIHLKVFSLIRNSFICIFAGLTSSTKLAGESFWLVKWNFREKSSQFFCFPTSILQMMPIFVSIFFSLRFPN